MKIETIQTSGSYLKLYPLDEDVTETIDRDIRCRLNYLMSQGTAWDEVQKGIDDVISWYVEEGLLG